MGESKRKTAQWIPENIVARSGRRLSSGHMRGPGVSANYCIRRVTSRGSAGDALCMDRKSDGYLVQRISSEWKKLQVSPVDGKRGEKWRT
jgi:hypothetical protein